MLGKGRLLLLGLLAVPLDAAKILCSRRAHSLQLPETQREGFSTFNTRTPGSAMPPSISTCPFMLSAQDGTGFLKGPEGKGTCLMRPSMCSPNTSVSENRQWRPWQRSTMYNYFQHQSQQRREGESPSSSVTCAYRRSVAGDDAPLSHRHRDTFTPSPPTAQWGQWSENSRGFITFSHYNYTCGSSILSTHI